MFINILFLLLLYAIDARNSYYFELSESYCGYHNIEFYSFFS